MTQSNILREMHDAFRESFLKPQAYRGADIEEALIESGLDFEADKIYARLSANGYLDCTDWHGPFDTLEDAARELIATYADT